MGNIIIVGSQGHAKVVIDIVEQGGGHRIVGLLDRFREVGERTMGYEILGGEEDLPDLVQKHSVSGTIIAIGDNFVRARVTESVARICPDLVPISAVHRRAAVARDVELGTGTVVMAGATINPGCIVGKSCILNTNSSLDHDSTMGDFASLGPRSVTGGYVEIDSYAAIGIGAVVSNSLVVGAHSVVGAGATVLEDIPANAVAYGTPARVIREREAGEGYIRPPRIPTAQR